VEDSVIALLKEVGLSKEAAKAFLAILRKQPASAADVCREAGIFDSKVYRALEELETRKLLLKQPGTPSRYSTPDPREILRILSDDIAAENEHKLKMAKKVVEWMKPLYEAAAPDSGFELAYIVRGKGTVIRSMSEVIGDARKEVVVLLSDPSIASEVSSSVAKASDRGVTVKLALGGKVRGEAFAALSPKLLDCECNIVVADDAVMASSDGVQGETGHAIVTSDEGMIRMAKGYYEGPGCCVT
jgi:sugar-specific transcriptional regulator TrmB